MPYYLNCGQARCRRMVSTLLASLWLSVVVLPCVMAQPFVAGGQDCIAGHQQDSGAAPSGMDCGDTQHCAIMVDEQPGNLVNALPYAVAQPFMVALWNDTFSNQRQYVIPAHPPDLPVVTPLERLPALRI